MPLRGEHGGAFHRVMDFSPALSARRFGITVDDSACDMDDLAPCGGVQVTVGGDEGWDEFVQRAVASSWPGIERLAGLGGSVADALRVNVERDGQAVAGVVASVGAYDRSSGRPWTFAFAECDFGPSSSRFGERLPDGELRYDVLDVTFLFQLGDKTAPIRDPELAARLGITVGERLALADYVTRQRRIDDGAAPVPRGAVDPAG